MGNDGSKGKRFHEAARYGQIYMQTDKSTYFGGETVTGKIYLNLLMPYPGNQIFLKFKGKESVHFVQQRQERYHAHENGQRVERTRYVDELFEDRNSIIKMMVPIYSWATLFPGQYTIPFAFMLPNNLPSSFYQEGHRYLAGVSYNLEAILEPALKLNPRLKCKQNFVVRQPVKNAQEGSSHEVVTPLKTCCCCAKGSNTLKAQFQKNYYAPGETAQVIMQLINTDSKINNSRISFTLKQRLVLNAKGRTESKTFTKVQRDLNGVNAGGQSDSNLIAINLPHFQGGDYSKIKTYSMTQHLINLKEDNNILNSATRSKLITSEYYLEVSAPMSGCCAPTPAITTPIEIYYPEFQFAPITMPSNWAPQEVGLVNVAFGTSSQMNINVNVDPNQMISQQPQMVVTNQQPQMIVTNQMPEANIQVNVDPNFAFQNQNVTHQNGDANITVNVDPNFGFNNNNMNFNATITTDHNNNNNGQFQGGFNQ